MFSATCFQSFVTSSERMQSSACGLKFCDAQHKLLVELSAWAQIRATKKKFFFIGFGLHLAFGRKIYLCNMKKLLLGFKQINFVIVLYPRTKFELICPA